MDEAEANSGKKKRKQESKPEPILEALEAMHKRLDDLAKNKRGLKRRFKKQKKKHKK